MRCTFWAAGPQGGLYSRESPCKVEDGMMMVRRFALVLAVLLPLLAPTMACALPSAHLSPAERACCQQMKGRCGSMGMPASHACCHKEVPTMTHWNAAVQTESVNVQINLAAIAGLPAAMILPLPVPASDHEQWPRTTLPQSSPSAISVLRI